MRKKELVAEISLITAKLNIGYEAAMKLDIETRNMYIDRVSEMFNKKGQTSSDQPLSKKEKEFIQSNQKMIRGEK